MKIVQIIPSLHGGGAEKFCIDLSNELSNNNDVIVCSLFDITDNMFMAKALNDKVKVITLHKKVGLDLAVFFKLYSLIKKENPDVINTHLRALLYIFLPILSKRYKVFHTVHSLANKETKAFFRLVYKFFYKFMNVTPVSISEKVLESVKTEYGNSFDLLINNGVKYLQPSDKFSLVVREINKLKNSYDTKVLLTVGRISEEKNHILLIRVVNQLIDEGYDIILLVIGHDTSNGEILLKELKGKAKENIFFLGNRENVIDYMNVADGFCMSSLYEGLPITLLEALSTSTIPVCTPAGGIVDVVSSEIGFISKGFTEHDYHLCLKEYLDSSKENLDSLKLNEKKIFFDKYNIQVTAKKYKIAYENIK